MALADDTGERRIMGLRSPMQVMDRAYEVSALPVVPTGFPLLDGVLGGGLRAGEPYGLAAATGQGKTSLVLQLASQHVASGGYALIWTREMPDFKLQARLVAQRAQVDWLTVLGGKMDRESYESHIAELEPRLRYYEGSDVHALERAARALDEAAKRAGCDKPLLIIVDYLQKLARSGSSPREGVTEASEALRAMASKLRAPLIIVSSVSRDAAFRIRGQRNVHPGELVDVAKESGAFEYDLAALLVLGQDPESPDGKQTAVITVAKNRFGQLGQVEFAFEGETGRFTELGRIESKARRDQRERRDRILAAVSAADGPLSKNAIHEAAGGNKRATLREIDAMVRDGELVHGRGGYMLGEACESHDADDRSESAPEGSR